MYSGGCRGRTRPGPGGSHPPTVSLSLLRLSLGMVKIGCLVTGSLEVDDEDGGSVSLLVLGHGAGMASGVSSMVVLGWLGSGTFSFVLICSLLVFAFSRPHPRGPLASEVKGFDLINVRGSGWLAGPGFSDVSVSVVSSELTLLVPLLTFSIELVGGLALLLLVWWLPFSITSGTLGGKSIETELFLLMDGEGVLSPLSGSLIGTRALMSLLVLVFLNLENSFLTK